MVERERSVVPVATFGNNEASVRNDGLIAQADQRQMQEAVIGIGAAQLTRVRTANSGAGVRFKEVVTELAPLR